MLGIGRLGSAPASAISTARRKHRDRQHRRGSGPTSSYATAPRPRSDPPTAQRDGSGKRSQPPGAIVRSGRISVRPSCRASPRSCPASAVRVGSSSSEPAGSSSSSTGRVRMRAPRLRTVTSSAARVSRAPTVPSIVTSIGARRRGGTSHGMP
jgi:hypothetical protein